MAEEAEDLYAVLGCERGADAAEIRRAYRRAAAAAHPDRKGGSNARMKAVNEAFEILNDPERRAAYDATGRRAPPEQPIEAEAREVLMRFIDAQLDEAPEHERLLQHVREVATNNIGMFQSNLNTARKAVARLEKRQGRVKVQEGVENLVNIVLERKLGALRTQVASFQRKIAVLNLIHKMLEAYEEELFETEGAMLLGSGPRTIRIGGWL